MSKMVPLALAAVHGVLLLAIAVVGLIGDVSWTRILHVTAMVWLGGPVVALVVAYAVHLRVPATSASAADPPTDPCLVDDRGRIPTQVSRVLADSFGGAG